MKFGNDWFYPEIDRKVLKQLSKRSNWQASKHVALFFSLLFLFGYLSFLFWSTWWFLLFYFLIQLSIVQRTQFGMNVDIEQLLDLGNLMRFSIR